MILFWLGTCYHTPILHKNAEKPTVMGFCTQILFESTVTKVAHIGVELTISNGTELYGMA